MSQNAGHGFDHAPHLGLKLWRALRDVACAAVMAILIWIGLRHLGHGVSDAADLAKKIADPDMLTTASLLAMVRIPVETLDAARHVKHAVDGLLKYEPVREVVVAACAGASGLAILFSILFAIYWAALSFEYFFGVAVVWAACAIICAAMWGVAHFMKNYRGGGKH